MALNSTYFEPKKVYEPLPVPETPGYTPPTPPTPPTPSDGDVPVIPRPTFTGDTTITLYVNGSENIMLDKVLSNDNSKTISVKEPISLITPKILLNGDYTSYNYMYMLGRYYFVYPTMLPGGITQIDAKCDVLMTYKNEIRSHTAVIERNAQVYNKYLNDVSFKTYAYKNTRTLKFPTGFSKTLNWILVTIGGATAPNNE